MSVKAFADARGYSARTVSRYCEQGMPHAGKGRARRILVVEADAWITMGGSIGLAHKAGVAAGAGDVAARAGGTS